MSEEEKNSTATSGANKKKSLMSWLKKLGVVGFLFFLIKGLVWLAVFFFAGSKAFESCN